MPDAPAPSIADLRQLISDNQRGPLTGDQVHDTAVVSLMVMRGLSRGDKLKVLRKMRRLLDA